MFKKIQIICAAICLTSLSMQAIQFINKSGKRVEFKDIVFNGAWGRHEAFTLDPESNLYCSWNLHGIKALTAIVKPTNQEFRFEKLTNGTSITLNTDLTHTRHDEPTDCCVTQ